MRNSGNTGVKKSGIFVNDAHVLLYHQGGNVNNDHSHHHVNTINTFIVTSVVINAHFQRYVNTMNTLIVTSVNNTRHRHDNTFINDHL